MRWRRAWHRVPLHTHRKGQGRGEGLLISVFLGVGLALLLIWAINLKIKPIYSTMATTKVTNAVTRVLENAVNSYIMEQDISYRDMIVLEKDETGAITALTSNMTRLNTMRNGILSDVVEAVDALEIKELSIRAGNLTGISLLSGHGFELPVRVISVGTAHAAFEHLFTAAGINQTRHQIMLNVTVTVSILLPGDTITTEVAMQVCAAETVIVGHVPDAYLQVGQ